MFQSADSPVSIAVVLFHHKVNKRATFTRSKVTPKVYTVIHLETGCIVLPKRAVVHTVIKFIHYGQNAQ